jgi:NtrC-family two-component system sensor histidine kinase KinB
MAHILLTNRRNKPMILKKKILVGYSVIFLLLSLVITWSVVNLVTLGKASNAILSENYRSILASNHMSSALERQDSYLLFKLLNEDNSMLEQIQHQDGEFLQWLARAKDNITIEGEQQLVDSIEQTYTQYRTLITQLFHGLTPSLYNKQILPKFNVLVTSLLDLRSMNEQTMYAASDAAGDVASRAVWSSSVLAAAALLIALLFSMLLAGRIVRPIERFAQASRRLSSGDYSVSVEADTHDELGFLAHEFNEMARKLKSYHEMNIEQIISEKHKSDVILASIEDGLVVFDTKLQVTGINPAARSIFRLDFSGIAGLSCKDIIHDQETFQMISEAVETGRNPEIPEENRIIEVIQDGKIHHFLLSITAFRGSDKSLSGIVMLLRDVTHLKEIEKLKSEFVMAASHELRTPLTSMGMSIDLIRERIENKLDPGEQELLEVAQQEVKRMKSLVNDLLDLSRLEAGKIDLEMEAVPIETLFGHIAEIYTSQLDMKHIHLSTQIQSGLPLMYADANKIAWVLSNLVSNALRYSKECGHIRIFAEDNGTQISISVDDDGPGIPKEYQSRIFQKFVRMNEGDSVGSGLGLAICKEIIRAHGGTIWVDSTPGKGSTFTFTVAKA